MNKFTIEKVICSEDTRPILLNFQNGSLENENLECALYVDDQGRRFVGAASELVYMGEVERDDLYENFLVIVNNNTNKARLVATDHATLSPVFPNRKKRKETVAEDSVDYTKSVMQLNKQFGSKRAKRQTEQRERLKLNIENARDYLEQTVADIEVDEENLGIPVIDEQSSSYKPPINRDASTVEDVYPLHTLVPKNILKSLEGTAENVLKTDDDSIITSDFIKTRILKLKKSVSPDSVRKCTILLYVDSLIKFLNSSAKSIAVRNFVACTYSSETSTYILDNFCLMAGNKRSRPNSMRDKALCYILVLSLLANDYRVNLEDIAREVKGKVKKLQDIGRVLALSPINSKDKNVLVLKLPLPPLPTAGGPPKRIRKK